MRYFYTPLRDTTLYQQFPNQNTGLDEIITAGKSDSGSFAVRSLVQFDLTAISQSMVNGTIPLSANFDFSLYVADAGSLNVGQIINVIPVSQSWTEGSGYFYQVPIYSTDGATWTYRSTGSLWAYSGSSTMSVSPITQTIPNPVADMTFDIGSIVRSWLSGTYPNNGILIQFPTSDEVDLTNQGWINFFSSNTHTIFRPTLTAKWNDQTFVTGSLTPWPSRSLIVIPENLQAKYFSGSIVRVDLAVRQKYPLKQFATVFTNYTGQSYLPTSSYFSIIDEQANFTIIPFDQYSQISTDPNASFFTFAVQNMFPLRYYKVLIKVIHDGLTEIFDTHETFTIYY